MPIARDFPRCCCLVISRLSNIRDHTTFAKSDRNLTLGGSIVASLLVFGGLIRAFEMAYRCLPREFLDM